MGFNKRFVDSKVIERYFDGGKTLDDLFKADAFIFMDDLASQVYRWYDKGLTDEEIKNKIQEYHNEKSRETSNV